jgi:Fe-S cluster biosynthesis and repair protein YggX
VPHMRSLINNQRFKRKNVEKYVESTIRHYYFKQHASYLDGYFNDYIFQKYFICEVIK